MEFQKNETLNPGLVEKLCAYRSENVLKKEAMNVIVRLLKHDQIKELKDAFQAIDTDNSGTISIQELCNAL